MKAKAKGKKSVTVAARSQIGIMTAAGIPIDFEIKLVAPPANTAPALRVVAGTEINVPLSSTDNKTWNGGISAVAGTVLHIFAASRVNKGGSMTITIKEPGFNYPPIKVEPVKGRCAVGPIKYPVG